MKLSENTALEIAEFIRKDITNRRGLRQEWEQIDNDVRGEIMNTWKVGIEKILTEATN